MTLKTKVTNSFQSTNQWQTFVKVAVFCCLFLVLNGCIGRYVIDREPPPPLVEVIGVAPGPGYQWIGGHWGWQDSWVWQSGRWEAPPYSDAAYIHGHWLHGSKGYSYVEGHWNKKAGMEKHEEEKHDDTPKRMDDGR